MNSKKKFKFNWNCLLGVLLLVLMTISLLSINSSASVSAKTTLAEQTGISKTSNVSGLRKKYADKQISNMVLVGKNGSDGVTNYYYVDKRTRVIYWMHTTTYKGTVTPLLNEDGTPMLFNGNLNIFE